MTASAPGGSTGIHYATTFVADFVNPPGSFLITQGALPTGLKLDYATGALTGYPRQVGNFNFEIAARDGADLSLPAGRDVSFSEARKRFSVSIARGEPNILPQVPPAAQYRGSYGYQIDVAGGTPPYTFAQTGGTLPTGMTVSPSGLLGSFPTAAQGVPYVFDVTVTDATGLQDTEQLVVDVVVLPLVILTPSQLAEGAQAVKYDVPIELASGGGGAPYGWSQVTPGPGEVDLSSIGLQISSIGHVTDTGAGPTAIGTFYFTLQVTDEPLQVATRQFSVKVNPGPVLTSISPKSSAIPGPYTVTGLNFQPGAKLLMKPGPTESVVSPTFISSTKMTFNAPVPKPSNGNGAVPVMVLNPDGGNHTLNGAFTFPAANLSFADKGFVASALSSTGLDVTDVNADGFADIVHCGSSGQTVFSGSVTSTAPGLIFHKNLGTSPPTFSTVTLDSSSFYDVKFADVNTDGKPDIVGLAASTIRVWLGNGDGTFSVGPSSAQPGGYSWPSELTIGRFNTDSIPDLAFCVSNWPSANLNGRVYTMLGNGSGGFTSADGAVTTMPTMTGVITLAAVDSDGNGRHEIIAGVGMLQYTGPSAAFSTISTSGTFGGWSSPGPTVGPPYYASTTGIAVADFLGNGTQQAIVSMNGSTYSATQVLYLFSGSNLGNTTALTPPGSRGKCCAVLDGDFDGKMDFVMTGTNSSVYVYRGGTGLSLVQTLDANSGSVSISSPQLGRIACGDLDNDGRPDIVATTSYWQTNGMAANYGSSYSMANTGNGGSMGVAFWMNTSN